MSLHIWRKIYYAFGWDYDKDLWVEQQRWNKYILCEEIKNNKVVLKPIFNIDKKVVILPNNKKKKKKK